MALNCIEVLIGGNYSKHACVAICSGSCYEGIIQGKARSVFRLVSNIIMESEKLAIESPYTGIFADRNTYLACQTEPLGGIFRLCSEAGEMFKLRNLSELYRLTRMEDRRRFSVTGTRKSLKGLFNAEIVPEQVTLLQNAAKIVQTEGKHRDILIEGPQGSGKSTIIRNMEKMLVKMGFDVCTAECQEGETYAHPLIPYVSLVSQIMTIIDTLPLKLPESIKPVEQKKEDKATFNTTEDRANRLLTRASTRKGIDQKRIHYSETLKESKIDNVKKNSAVVWNKYKSKVLGPNLTGKVFPDTPIPEGKEIKVEKKSVILTNHMNEEIISKFRLRLQKAGENVNATLPLLNPLIQPTIPETSETENPSPDSRTSLLSALIVRLIDKLSEKKSIAIIIDDTQWMDSASWIITMNIIRRCKRLLVVLTSKPCNDWRYQLLRQITSMPNALSIELHGSTTTDLLGTLSRQFDAWAENIDSKLVESIKRRTEGKQTILLF
jgi:hypothetical protein